jgi:predicted nucleic acid-binding protein
MRRAEKIYYWDTCIFLAILKGETRAPGEMEGARAVATAIERGDAVLLTSVITRTEILDGKIPPESLEILDALFKRPNLQRADVTQAISDLAHNIRDQLDRNGTKIKTPDALHFATAVVYRVDEFHTFDNQLLSLDGSPIVNSLRIVKPRTRQGELF